MINKIPIDIQINFVFNFFTVFIGVKYRILLTIMYATMGSRDMPMVMMRRRSYRPKLVHYRGSLFL